MADRTAPFVLDYAAALRTGAALLPDYLGVDIITVIDHMVLDGLCNGIGAGRDAVVAEA